MLHAKTQIIYQITAIHYSHQKKKKYVELKLIQDDKIITSQNDCGFHCTSLD